MVAYYINYVIVLGLSSLAPITPYLRVIVSVLMALVLAFFAGTFMGSKDLWAYREIFDMVPSAATLPSPRVLESIYGEAGFKYAISAFKTITDNFLIFHFVWVAGALWIKLHFFNRLAPYAAIAVVWYTSFFLYLDMTAIRQGFAASLVLAAAYGYYRGHYWLFLVLTICAASIHTVAVAALLIPLFYLFSGSRLLIVLILVAAATFGHMGFGIWAVEGLRLSGIDLVETNRIIDYAEGRYGGEQGLFRGVVIKQVGILLCVIAMAGPRIKEYGITRLLVAVYLLSTVVLVALQSVAILADRVSAFFAVVECILVATVPLFFRGEERIAVSVFILLLASVQFFRLSSSLFVDYQSPLFFLYGF